MTNSWAHGNTLPHLHLHLYPRYRDDPFPGQPIDYTEKIYQYEENEFKKFVSEMRNELDKME